MNVACVFLPFLTWLLKKCLQTCGSRFSAAGPCRCRLPTLRSRPCHVCVPRSFPGQRRSWSSAPRGAPPPPLCPCRTSSHSPGPRPRASCPRPLPAPPWHLQLEAFPVCSAVPRPSLAEGSLSPVLFILPFQGAKNDSPKSQCCGCHRQPLKGPPFKRNF